MQSQQLGKSRLGPQRSCTGKGRSEGKHVQDLVFTVSRARNGRVSESEGSLC